MTPRQRSRCLGLAAFAAVAFDACSSSSRASAESAYLAQRTEYSRTITQRFEKESTAVFPAESVALRDLEHRLREVIGPFKGRGTKDSGQITLSTLLADDPGSNSPDGLLFESRKDSTRTFVTTTRLFSAWLAIQFARDHTVPTDPRTALTRDDVYTAIFDDNAAVIRYAELPVTSPTKQVLAAMLVDRAQDICLTCAPRTILLGVSAGDRLFVVDAPARDAIPIPTQCREAASADTRAQQAIDAYHAGGNSDSSQFNQYTRAEDERFADLRKCYATAAPSDPRFARIIAQARALVEALPER